MGDGGWAVAGDGGMRAAGEPSWPEAFFYAVDEEVQKADVAQLPALLAQGKVGARTLAWVDTMEGWGALGDLSTLEHLGPGVDQDVRRQLCVETSAGDRSEQEDPGADQPISSPGGTSTGGTSAPQSEHGISARHTGDLFCSVRYADPRTNAPSDEVPVDRLRRALADGELNAQALVWTDGMDSWTPLCDCFEQFGLVRAELGIMRQHIELQMSEASATNRREIRTPVAGTDWDRVEVIERQSRDGEDTDEAERDGDEVYFVHRETGESVWELDPDTVEQAAAAAAGVARPSSGGWLARENKTLCAENARLKMELEAARVATRAALQRETETKRRIVSLQQENAALRGRLQPPRV